MKVAICGRMASGKTTLANWFVDQGYQKVSLAAKVKDIARDLFKMKNKDRRLLQKIGMKMREIRPDVWIEYLIGTDGNLLVVDDVRFVNEARSFKAAGWVLIRLNIDEDLQKKRLQRTYPDDWETHWNNRSDSSETEVDMIPADLIDIEITSADEPYPFEVIMDYVQCMVNALKSL